jgi:hypothetical protein
LHLVGWFIWIVWWYMDLRTSKLLRVMGTGLKFASLQLYQFCPTPYLTVLYVQNIRSRKTPSRFLVHLFIYESSFCQTSYHLYSSIRIGGATRAVGYMTSKPTGSTKQHSSKNIVNLYFALILHYKWWLNWVQNSSLQIKEKKPLRGPRYRWEDNTRWFKYDRDWFFCKQDKTDMCK